MIAIGSELYELFTGNSLEVLSELPDNCIDSVVTDPPYELGFMGKSWDKSGIANNVDLWAEVLRVLKPGGSLLAFSGSRTYHRMVCAIEDAGFEIRDQLMWLYATGFPKAKNALKPAHEPIVLARKPFKGSLEKNIEAWGVGAMNIEDCRIGDEVLPAQSAGQSTLGTFERSNMLTPERVGRWPANVLHDGSDEVRELFPDSVGQRGDIVEHNRPRDSKGIYGDFPPAVDAIARIDSDTSAARFFYCAKASKKDRGEGNNHPTVKPTELMQWLVRLITPEGGLVLDPFCGSGSTGKACLLEGRRFVGIDLSDDYLDIAERRMEEVLRRKAA